MSMVTRSACSNPVLRGDSKRGRDEPLTFRAIHDRYLALVRTQLWRLGVREDALDDATQEVFAVAHRKWSCGEPPATWSGWLRGTARRIAWRYRRSALRRMHRRLALADAGRTFDDDEPRWQALLTIEAALTRIHAPVRAAFELVELRGLSATEAATHLGVPISTIYGRLAIARRDLKRIYAELGVAPSNRRRNQKKASRSKVPALFLARLETGWGSKLVAAVIAMCTLAGVVIVAKRIEEREQRDGAPSMSPRKPEPAPVTWFERSEARIPPGHTSTQAGKRRLETASSPVPSVDPQPGRGSSSLRRPPIRRNPVAASSDSTSVEEADTDGAGADSRSADDLGREVALLRAAKDALRRADGSRALKILDRHGRRYPDGALEQARLATRVRALCSLGRIAEASALAKRLRQRQSGTTLLPPRSPCEPKISISKEVDAGD